MVSLAQVFLAVAMVAGVALCGLGYVSHRRWDEPGATLFGAFAVVWGGLPLVDAAVVATTGTDGTVAGLYWVVAISIWCLFALQYTGRAVTRRTLAALFVPVLGLVPWFWALATAADAPLLEALGILVFAYYTALSVVGAILVVRAARRYGHISLSQGAVLAAAGLLPPVTMNTFGILTERATETVLFGIYTAGMVGVCLAVALALFRYDVFDATPAAGTIGERAIARETDDLVLVADDEGRVAMRNETASQRLPTSDDEALGAPVETSLEVALSALRDSETVEIRTEEGHRKFDPQVTTLVDQHGRETGAMVSLRDVTDREIRRQRLAVLNRFVRHNLRNQAGVVTANTETVADELDDDRLVDHLDTATDAVDSLTDVGATAKRVQALLDRERDPSEVDLAAVLGEVADDADDRWPGVTLTVDAPDGVTVESDAELLAFAVETLVDALPDHGGEGVSEVTLALNTDATAEQHPVTVTVRSDGPGIPEQERAVVEAGTETPLQHGTGIRLWAATWAVRELGGDLSVAEGGRVVEVDLPHEPLA